MIFSHFIFFLIFRREFSAREKHMVCLREQLLASKSARGDRSISLEELCEAEEEMEFIWIWFLNSCKIYGP